MSLPCTRLTCIAGGTFPRQRRARPPLRSSCEHVHGQAGADAIDEFRHALQLRGRYPHSHHLRLSFEAFVRLAGVVSRTCCALCNYARQLWRHRLRLLSSAFLMFERRLPRCTTCSDAVVAPSIAARWSPRTCSMAYDPLFCRKDGSSLTVSCCGDIQANDSSPGIIPFSFR